MVMVGRGWFNLGRVFFEDVLGYVEIGGTVS